MEPWTGEYNLPPGGSLALVAEGDRNMPIEVELSGDRATFYCFDSEGAQVSVFRDGQEMKSAEVQSGLTTEL